METLIHTYLNPKDLDIPKTSSFESFNFWRRIRFWILDWSGHLPFKCLSCCSALLRCQNEHCRKSPGRNCWAVDSASETKCLRSHWVLHWYATTFLQRPFFKKYQATVPGRTKSCLLNLSCYLSILQDLEGEIKATLIWKPWYVNV